MRVLKEKQQITTAVHLCYPLFTLLFIFASLSMSGFRIVSFPNDRYFIILKKWKISLAKQMWARKMEY